MTEDKPNQHANKKQYKVCPECNRKGLYNIKAHYYRCRYCGKYIVASDERLNGESTK